MGIREWEPRKVVPAGLYLKHYHNWIKNDIGYFLPYQIHFNSIRGSITSERLCGLEQILMLLNILPKSMWIVHWMKGNESLTIFHTQQIAFSLSYMYQHDSSLLCAQYCFWLLTMYSQCERSFATKNFTYNLNPRPYSLQRTSTVVSLLRKIKLSRFGWVFILTTQLYAHYPMLCYSSFVHI